MNEYKIVKITDLGTVNRGKSKHRPRNDSILYGGEYPFIQTDDVKKANLHLVDYTQTYNDVGLKQSKLWKKGTLCFTIAANIADSAILGMDACFPDSIVGFLPYENVSDTTYVKYLFDELKLYFQQISKGTTQDNLSLDKICRVKLRVPDYDTQVKVASILSTYDTAIENNNKRIRLLEQMAENIYKEWFVRFRFPGYKDVEFIDGFPKNWEKVKLDDVLNKIATGLNPRKNFVLGEGENFYVTIKNMADNTVYLDDKCDKVNDDAIIKINKRSDLKVGDLLFSGIGTIGRVCLIDIPTNNWNISESVFTMRANKKISSEFLYMLLLSQDIQNYCQSKANGSAQKGIRMGDLRKYTFLLPTKNVINDFTNQISPILRNVSLLRNENKNLIQQRDMLLPRLMSGKLEV